MTDISIRTVCFGSCVSTGDGRRLLGVCGALVPRLLLTLRCIRLQLHTPFIGRVEPLLRAVAIACRSELDLAFLAWTASFLRVFATSDAVLGVNNVDCQSQHVLYHSWQQAFEQFA